VQAVTRADAKVNCVAPLVALLPVNQTSAVAMHHQLLGRRACTALGRSVGRDEGWLWSALQQRSATEVACCYAAEARRQPCCLCACRAALRVTDGLVVTSECLLCAGPLAVKLHPVADVAEGRVIAGTTAPGWLPAELLPLGARSRSLPPYGLAAAEGALCVPLPGAAAPPPGALLLRVRGAAAAPGSVEG